MTRRLAWNATMVWLLGVSLFGCGSSSSPIPPPVLDGGGADAVQGDAGCADPVRMAAYSFCLASPDQATCEERGGRWSQVAFGQISVCLCDTGQGACPCTTSSECLAGCVYPASGASYSAGCNATSGMCSAGTTPGCVCVEQQGVFTVRCVD